MRLNNKLRGLDVGENRAERLRDFVRDGRGDFRCERETGDVSDFRIVPSRFRSRRYDVAHNSARRAG